MNGAPIARNGCLSAADGSYVCGAVPGVREGFLAPPKPTLPAASAGVLKPEPFYAPGTGNVVAGMKSALSVMPPS